MFKATIVLFFVFAMMATISCHQYGIPSGSAGGQGEAGFGFKFGGNAGGGSDGSQQGLPGMGGEATFQMGGGVGVGGTGGGR